MKKRQFAFLLLAVVLLSSCSILQSSSSFMKIEQGMTQQEVISLCGEPQYKRFDEVGEEWEYRAFLSNNWSIIVINFAEGRVVALDMFKEPDQSIATLPVSPVNPPITGISPTYPPTQRPNQKPGHNRPSSQRGMSDKEFTEFYNSVRSGFSSDRLKKVRAVDLTSAQCQKLIGLFPFTDEKIEAMIEMYPRVIDKQNYYKVIDLLTFTSEKDKVRASIERYNKNNR